MEVNFITSNNGYKVHQDQQKKNKDISQSITSESFAAAAACNYAPPEGRPPPTAPIPNMQELEARRSIPQRK
jgi:hypothetical protein